MKLTGDLHPPEVEYDLGRAVEEPEYGATTALVVPDLRAEGAALLPAMERQQAPRYLQAARTQVRAHPVVAVVAAFALGLALARI